AVDPRRIHPSLFTLSGGREGSQRTNMRIAFLSVSAKLGGSEMMLRQILRELRAANPGWDLHLVVPSAGPLAVDASALGVSVHEVAMPESLRTLGEWATGRRRPLTLAARLSQAALGVPGYSRR